MIATDRRISAHDFLLVAVAVSVIVLSAWPPTQAGLPVQVRQADGTIRSFSVTENDPALANLRRALERWARAGQETPLAIAQWQAELADFYVAKSVASDSPSPSPIRPVSFRNGNAQPTYWETKGQQARAEIKRIQEIRRSRTSREVTPPVEIGQLQAGRKPGGAILAATVLGLLTAIGFAGWTFLCPTLRLYQMGDLQAEAWKNEAESGPAEMQLVVPSDWVRLRQPTSVMIRRAAMGFLTLLAVASLLR